VNAYHVVRAHVTTTKCVRCLRMENTASRYMYKGSCCV